MIEYTTNAVDPARQSIDYHLHSMGSRGWELCTIIPSYSGDFMLFVYRRPQQDLFDRRQLATILGALRILQFEHEWKAGTFQSVYEAQMDVLTDGGTLEPLTLVEIDELCEKLNTGKEIL